MTISTTDDDSLVHLKGVGKAMLDKLHRLNIYSLNDLVFHLPFRYEDRTQIVNIDYLRPMQIALVQGEVISNQVINGRKRSLLIRISDGTGVLGLRFYFVTAALQRQFSVGKLVRVFGEARPAATGLEFYHPEIQSINSLDDDIEQTLTPVYHATDGLSQKQLRKLMAQAMQELNLRAPVQLLPPSLLPAEMAFDLLTALNVVHHPQSEDIDALLNHQHPARKRLALEELVAHNLFLRRNKKLEKQRDALLAPIDSMLLQQLTQSLPFTLTGAQQRVINEIHQDMRAGKAMTRLVQGDVGAGKTLVAMAAALFMLEQGAQCAFMAPTEILAEQHYSACKKLLAPLGIEVELLLGRLSAKQKQSVYQRLASGEIHLLVGTHALFQEAVNYHHLALVIIDEQHRFGVDQRLALLAKGQVQGFTPHQLAMTATPIPRTLSMTYYADLDCSIIDELPPGRQPIQTSVIGNDKRQQVIDRVHQACLQGRQVYWVNTLIEENEELDLEAAEKTRADLQMLLPDLRIGLVHGKQKSQDKQATMDAFKRGELQLLVATTVIEVGVDVPNASIMVIENPERLGLSQLHQLRGRVGRGSQDSYCLLMYQAPLARHSKERLNVLRTSTDGFYIAEKDLELRGPGEFIGTRQTGDADFAIANIIEDQSLISLANSIAQKMLDEPQINQQALIERWLKDKQRYSKI